MSSAGAVWSCRLPGSGPRHRFRRLWEERAERPRSRNPSSRTTTSIRQVSAGQGAGRSRQSAGCSCRIADVGLTLPCLGTLRCRPPHSRRPEHNRKDHRCKPAELAQGSHDLYGGRLGATSPTYSMRTRVSRRLLGEAVLAARGTCRSERWYCWPPKAAANTPADPLHAGSRASKSVDSSEPGSHP